MMRRVRRGLQYAAHVLCGCAAPAAPDHEQVEYNERHVSRVFGTLMGTPLLLDPETR